MLTNNSNNNHDNGNNNCNNNSNKVVGMNALGFVWKPRGAAKKFGEKRTP